MESLHWRLLRVLAAWDYARLVPASGRWPLPLGLAVSRVRGCLNACLDQDWKTVSIRQHYVAARLRDAYPQFRAANAADYTPRWRRRLQRFLMGAREEWEAALMIGDRLGELEVSFENVAPLLERRRTGRGMVLLTAHFDSTLLGVCCMGRLGAPLHLATSNVVLDPVVPAAIQRFFIAKYEAMQRHFNGGSYVHVETRLKSLYAALHRGEWVVILGDGPGTPDQQALALPFLGATRLFAPGAVRIAQATGADMAAMVCLYQGGNAYQVVVSDVEPAVAVDDQQALQRLYGFLERHIRSLPGRWWAAEQLTEFPIVERAHAT